MNEYARNNDEITFPRAGLWSSINVKPNGMNRHANKHICFILMKTSLAESQRRKKHNVGKIGSPELEQFFLWFHILLFFTVLWFRMTIEHYYYSSPSEFIWLSFVNILFWIPSIHIMSYLLIFVAAVLQNIKCEMWMNRFQITQTFDRLKPTEIQKDKLDKWETFIWWRIRMLLQKKKQHKTVT